MLERIAAGRTDLVFDYLAAGHSPTSTDSAGLPLIAQCAYYGDVTALRVLLNCGASLEALGPDRGLNAAAFHGHWQLCQFLLENGADVNRPLADTGETPLHAALCTDDRLRYDLVVTVLLANGASPNRATTPNAVTGSFMRDCRTRGETPLHRAAAFGTESTVGLLLAAGASRDARDMNGDSPLTWASWYCRPASILRLLCHGHYAIDPNYGSGMRANLLGTPYPGGAA
ncbi:MAG: ankyrin repeat domain-containing protein [Thermoanaerobaculia bacterium]